MAFAHRFEELEVWKSSKELSLEIYGHFRNSRDFGFRDQIQRAAVSVMNNIAEGFERRTKQDFARFLDQAKGSAGEVRSMLSLAESLNYVPKAEGESLQRKYETLSRSIGAFSASLRRKIAPT
jgi:four helix bundle protein